MPGSDHLDELVAALIALMGALNNPRQDDVLLQEADVSIERALFPLIVRLSVIGPMGVAELADHAGRDHTTISRQLKVLERLGLVKRRANPQDGRVRQAILSAAGRLVAKRIAHARRRLLSQLLDSWSASECEAFARLALKMADGMKGIREKANLRTLEGGN
jgi:DNA-binding MarR family transcriptional regulator